MSYCTSRFQSIRRRTIEVRAGEVGMGGDNPIRVQSMTTSDTQDVAATVRQAIALAEVGCEIVRVTAPNVAAARCLREIRAEFSRAGFSRVPLVADIHFLPQAAMEAVEHVEKIRINPGNYADKKRFAVREYSDADYQLELERLHESFTPLVRRAKELGRCLRIGTNHGSLSDRIMNRYGDTPLGMVESALEFLRIAESHGFRQLVLSMKSSNPKVMIQAYRLLVERMDAEDMHYPLHLGVTEAGDGEDGRIKSAIGIGSLLLDGLGDTIRVSLTEDSVYEIPVAQAIAARAHSRWAVAARRDVERADRINPHQFSRRITAPIALAPSLSAGGSDVPRVLVRTTLAQWPTLAAAVNSPLLSDTPIEGALVRVDSTEDLARVRELRSRPATRGPELLALECGAALSVAALAPLAADDAGRLAFVHTFDASNPTPLTALAALAGRHGHTLAVATTSADVPALAEAISGQAGLRLVVTLADGAIPSSPGHAVGAYRALAEALASAHLLAPLWIRSVSAAALLADPSFLGRLLEAAMLAGPLLTDGLGDLLSIETESDPVRAAKLAYNVLQGAGVRISKTEFVACPSCGRTLFDLQSTTQRIRAQTGHLKGVKIAIMGCIVNGPGEMADADFGYVGGAPGKINLYVGKNCVQYNVPQADADARLIALIREHGRWVDPRPASA
jgi:(E)-4-hydroxy-3-methylbut-2-enyl-diphosphate synthase